MMVFLVPYTLLTILKDNVPLKDSLSFDDDARTLFQKFTTTGEGESERRNLLDAEVEYYMRSAVHERKNERQRNDNDDGQSWYRVSWTSSFTRERFSSLCNRIL